jgi:hypothetical protein
MFKLIKYSSILFFLGKHRSKLFRSVAVLLFAFVTSLLYEDVRVFLTEQHPDTLIFALIGKITIVYGSLIFVLLQFRPGGKTEAVGEARAAALGRKNPAKTPEPPAPGDRLDALADLEQHQQLRSRYDRILAKGATENQPRNSSSTKSSRS